MKEYTLMEAVELFKKHGGTIKSTRDRRVFDSSLNTIEDLRFHGEDLFTKWISNNND